MLWFNQPSRARAAAAAGVLMLVPLLAQCGSDESEPPAPAPAAPAPPEEAPAEQGEYGQGGSNLEEICAAAYGSRGRAPESSSGNMDDDMALFQMWHAQLIQNALSQFPNDAPGDLTALMGEHMQLSRRAAQIYNEHPIINQELTEIQTRQAELTGAVSRIANAAGAPSCADIIILP